LTLIAFASCWMSDYKKLEVWRKAHTLAVETHKVSCGIRSTKYSAIRSQLIRASASVPTNIVEGSGQKSAREFSRFLGIAVNSINELEYHLLYGCEIGILDRSAAERLNAQIEEVRKMLYGLIKKLGSNIA
jgi:four helix bundle protein